MAKIQGLGATGPIHIIDGGSSGATAKTDANAFIIESDDDTGLSIITPNDKIAKIAMGDPEDADRLFFIFNQSTSVGSFQIGDVPALNIDTTGVIINEGGSTGKHLRCEGQTITDLLFVDSTGENVHINNTTGATTSKGNLHVGIGTAPTAALAGGIVIGAKDSSVGSTDATLELWLETAPIAVGTFTASHKMPWWVNGVEYHIQLDAV